MPLTDLPTPLGSRTDPAPGVELWRGDCIDVLRTLPDNSVDSIVTDPPYGLEFMGKEWDSFAPRDRKNASVWDGRRQGQEGWKEKAEDRSGKGGAGPSYRSQHKGSRRCAACGRRQLSGSPCRCSEPEWVIEHRQEAPATMIAFQRWVEAWARESYRVLKPGGHLLAFGGSRTYHRLTCGIEDAGFEIRDGLVWLYASGFPKSRDVYDAIRAEAMPATRELAHAEGLDGWAAMALARPDHFRGVMDDTGDGWGTALKPAQEPIVMARKPLTGTVAGNVLAWGTGAINVDACRVEHASAADLATSQAKNPGRTDTVTSGVYGSHRPQQSVNVDGRWPTNVVLSHAPDCGPDDSTPCVEGCPVAELDRQSGILKTNAGTYRRTKAVGDRSAYQIDPKAGHITSKGDSGGASRFYPTFRFQAKAPTRERPSYLRPDGTRVAHPTVKPLALMRWIVRLVTPPGGLVADVFAGSGPTVEACMLEGFRVLAIERDRESIPLVGIRVDRTTTPPVPVAPVVPAEPESLPDPSYVAPALTEWPHVMRECGLRRHEGRGIHEHGNVRLWSPPAAQLALAVE